jgi:two-component system phosphate regulon sensor histidine kinase PhoR
MTVAARRYAGGDLSQRVPRPDTAELAELAVAMNDMADQLGERMRLVVQQRDEAEAVLSGMVEGVLRIDAGERVLGVNPAAAALLRVDPQTAQGRPLHEVMRNVALQRFVARTLAGSGSTEDDLVLRDDEERFLQAHGTVLTDADGHARGCVVVLNNVTRLRRLEAIRRDFVANVSHELKTPITSLQGFVETLQQSDVAEEDRARFLDIVARQAERLHAIIEDLLVLSRVEREAERAELPLEASPLRPVLEAAIQLCAAKAAEKRITVQLACAAEVDARINPPLLEEAVVNLLDNAIKYSEPETVVNLRAARENGDGEVVITVRDQGCGIAREHLPRIFERFYRVDKSRSRELGGTGLGLSIVRHIVQAHRGAVEVESTPGQGSTFTLRLPANS